LCLMFEQELSQRNATTAEAILSEIHEPSPQLKERLSALQQAQEQQRQEQQRLSEFQQQFDISVSRKQRMHFALATTGFVSVVALSLTLCPARAATPPSSPMPIVIAALGSLFLGLLTFLGKGSLLKNDINRRMIYSFLLGTAVLTVGRVQGMLLKIPIQ